MVSKAGLQRQIADVLGWTDFRDWRGTLGGMSPEGVTQDVPNWPIDRNASYELIKGIQFGEFPEVLSAREESLLFLEHKGWRWVDCAKCIDGREKCPDCDSRGHLSHDPPQPKCTDCNGDKGAWVRL